MKHVLFIFSSLTAGMLYVLFTQSDKLIVQVLCVVGLILYCMLLTFKVIDLIEYLHDKREQRYYKK